MVKLLKYPTEQDWIECKQRAVKTMGLKVKTAPSEIWKVGMLQCKHSPIRCLNFSFELTVPYFVSVHLCRHVHATPYIQSQRNDRQSSYDRNSATQDQLVQMIWDMNAEELITIAEKRMCLLSSLETRKVIREMVRQVIEKCPEFRHELKPVCAKYQYCKEMFPCGRAERDEITMINEFAIKNLGDNL